MNTTNTPSSSHLNDTYRNLSCPHSPLPTKLCNTCRSQSYGYWNTFMSLWIDNLPTAHLQNILYLVLEYILILHDLHDTGMPPPFGRHPHPLLMMKLLKIDLNDMHLVLELCFHKPVPIMFYQDSAEEPPYIENQLRMFLTDQSRMEEEEDAYHLRDMVELHQIFGKRYLQRFSDIIQGIKEDDDHNDDDDEIKAYVGLGWIQHAMRNESAFDDLDLSQLCRTHLLLSEWFKWMLAESWNKLQRDMSSVIINPIGILTEFITRFLHVSPILRGIHLETLDTELKRFFNLQYIRYFDKGNDKSIAKRFISSAWFLSFPGGGPNNSYLGGSYLSPTPFEIPDTLRLDRHRLLELLSFNRIVELDDVVEEPGDSSDDDDDDGDDEDMVEVSQFLTTVEVDVDTNDSVPTQKPKPLRRTETNRLFREDSYQPIDFLAFAFQQHTSPPPPLSNTHLTTHPAPQPPRPKPSAYKSTPEYISFKSQEKSDKRAGATKKAITRSPLVWDAITRAPADADNKLFSSSYTEPTWFEEGSYFWGLGPGSQTSITRQNALATCTSGGSSQNALGTNGGPSQNALASTSGGGHLQNQSNTTGVHPPNQNQNQNSSIEMDKIFGCQPLLEVWLTGDRCEEVKRDMGKTHRDLTMCCLGVLIGCRVAGRRSVDGRILEYAKKVWSHHLAYAESSVTLLKTLERLTMYIVEWETLPLDNELGQHATRVSSWLRRKCSSNEAIVRRLQAKWQKIDFQEMGKVENPRAGGPKFIRRPVPYPKEKPMVVRRGL
ncbi:hypothetical protein BDN72DRAFT_841118 [Pluteus cervinus]|uniref:Uncharacterized protein n=1 Tax=Pluteus cervinus TaxID=181527 RepID=A0ACD3ATI9_9AGAR|nr:hypothetical protein BDN72DRAFT_841118 [Pluteus cervinus]